MTFLLGPFALTSSPFSRRRFMLFMALLAAISAVSLFGMLRAPNQVATAAAGNETAIVRFAQPLADTQSDLRQIGLPWFLAQQGASAKIESQIDGISVEVGYEGKVVGRYDERVVPLGEGRSKLFITFVPNDMRLVGLFAAPIETKLDPVSLFRVVMAEHIRASINGGGFDMNVLTDTPGSRFAVFRKAFADSGRCENPQIDDFPTCSREDQDAGIRRAYREEAQREGQYRHY